MENEKKGDTLEYWIRDSLYSIKMTDEQVAELVRIFGERKRQEVEDVLKLYDPEIDNWKHYRHAVWKALPKRLDDSIAKVIDLWIRKGEVEDLVGNRQAKRGRGGRGGII